MSKEQKEDRVLYYYCPTCREILRVKVESPVISGSPVCAECNGQVWRKSKEWYENEKKCGRAK